MCVYGGEQAHPGIQDGPWSAAKSLSPLPYVLPSCLFLSACFLAAAHLAIVATQVSKALTRVGIVQG